jgi:hypothetical protein
MTIIELVFWLSLFVGNYQNSAVWNGIVLFHSTRGDVDRKLGPPTESCNEVCDYDTKTEGIFVRYSGERCPRGDAGALNVSPNTVISIKVYPLVKQKLKDLKLDMTKFTKTRDPELHGYSTYTNAEAGITYEVSDKNRVLSVEWFGSAKDLKALRCP